MAFVELMQTSIVMLQLIFIILPIVVYHILLCINTHLTDINFTYQQIHHSSIIARQINKYHTAQCIHYHRAMIQCGVFLGAVLWRVLFSRHVTVARGMSVMTSHTALLVRHLHHDQDRPIYTLKYRILYVTHSHRWRHQIILNLNPGSLFKS